MRCGPSRGTWVWVCMQKWGNAAATKQIPLDTLNRGCYWQQVPPCLPRVGPGSSELSCLRKKRRGSLCPFLDKRMSSVSYEEPLISQHCVCVVQTVPRASIYLIVIVSWTSLSEMTRCQVSCPRSTCMV